jgi:AraC-like DNA-binding protein
MDKRGADRSVAERLPVPAGRLRPGLQSLQHQLLPDPAAAYAAMAPVAALREFQPLVAECDFYQEIGLLQINQQQLISYVSAPVHFSYGRIPQVLLVASFAGGRFVRTPAGVVACRAGGGALLPPGSAAVSGSDSAAVIALRPDDLQRTAAAIAAEPGRPARFSGFSPRELGVVQARQLHALMRHLDACVHCHPGLPAQLGLDDVVLRLVVTWLQPQLLEESAADQRRIHDRAGSSTFDALIDYIRANLDQPLRLSDLEARSHYSSRALQYAFREQLGCTPRQWIRQQRLERAMDQLQQGGGGVSVKAIALACGYRHLSQFSADFKRHFGLSPSAVLRGGGLLVQMYAVRCLRRAAGLEAVRPSL